MVYVPPEVLGLFTDMGVTLARAKHADRQAEERLTGVTISAAVSAIELCGSRHPAGSPVWAEVVQHLGTASGALNVVDCLAQQRPLPGSPDAAPFLREFAERFITGAVDTSPGAKAETAAILAAIGLLKAHLPATPSLIDPLESIPWHRRPGAPLFEISPGLDGTRFLLTVGLVGGNEPGDIRASWSVNGGPEVYPLLMPQPHTSWRRQAKPAECQWPADDAPIAHLRLRFVTSEGEHGYHYWFPLERHPKGHWIFHTELGTTVHAPEPF